MGSHEQCLSLSRWLDRMGGGQQDPCNYRQLSAALLPSLLLPGLILQVQPGARGIAVKLQTPGVQGKT